MASQTRSFWKGHLRLALVNIPIRLVSATASDEKIAFHQVDKKTKQRIRYQKVAGENGQPVEQDDIAQGFEVEPGNYVLFESEELDALKLSTRHTVELVQFVDPVTIDPVYFDKPYYVLPDGEVAEEGYRVIRDALAHSNTYGIGQITMRGRENLVALKPFGAGLMLETLRYESEIKDADQVFSGIGREKLQPALIQMAEKLIEERSGDFNAGDYKNHYAAAVRELVRTKMKGGETVAVAGGEDSASSGTVIDFMEALRRSVKATAGAPKSAARSSRARKTSAASRTLNDKKSPPPARGKQSRR